MPAPRWLAATLLLATGFAWSGVRIPDPLQPWMTPQNWIRDSTGPVVSLGEPGAFDDTHLFAPCVAFEGGVCRLWYCGSRGEVAERVFRLGLAESEDGIHFSKRSDNPVYEFGDGKNSVLTPTLLRSPDGAVLREDGKLRMWFTAADLTQPNGLHSLRETRSVDGVRWDPPSEAQLDHVYAPTILKENGLYRLWYTDVSEEPWKVRLAKSGDGRNWEVHPEPVLTIDQEWEEKRLFYTTVLKADGVYLMWYGSYWSEHANKTALGLAASEDGIAWFKNPHNPVLRPDPSRPWESHYTTSESVMRFPDGSFRIWYGTRKAPPFVNKYFAIGTARWEGPR